MDPKYIILIGGLFLLAGLGGMFGLWWRRRRYRESSQWPSVGGEVVFSKMTEEADSEAGTLYGADIRYRYEVGKTRYESNQVEWASDYKSSGGGWARKRLAKYPVGTQVAVYYKQSDPQVAVLEPTTHSGAWMAMMFPVGLTIMGCGVLLVVALL